MSNVGFAVGTGRCGTKFLAELFGRDPQVAAHHERHAFSDTFHRYCRWYGVAVDEAGFVETKRRAIEEDLRRYCYSFEASAFLSLSIVQLYEGLHAKFVLMVRRPDEVVASYWQKGWYRNPPVLENPALPPTMQNVTMPHHFLGRIMPTGMAFERWSKLTRVGKIAWYWSRLNAELLQQAERLPRGAALLQKLEDLDFATFCTMRDFLGAPKNLNESRFRDVLRRRPNASRPAYTARNWSPLERHEFESEVRDVAERLGYAWRLDDIRELSRPRPRFGDKLVRFRVPWPAYGARG